MVLLASYVENECSTGKENEKERKKKQNKTAVTLFGPGAAEYIVTVKHILAF